MVPQLRHVSISVCDRTSLCPLEAFSSLNGCVVDVLRIFIWRKREDIAPFSPAFALAAKIGDLQHDHRSEMQSHYVYTVFIPSLEMLQCRGWRKLIINNRNQTSQNRSQTIKKYLGDAKACDLNLQLLRDEWPGVQHKFSKRSLMSIRAQFQPELELLQKSRPSSWFHCLEGTQTTDPHGAAGGKERKKPQEALFSSIFYLRSLFLPLTP